MTAASWVASSTTSIILCCRVLRHVGLRLAGWLVLRVVRQHSTYSKYTAGYHQDYSNTARWTYYRDSLLNNNNNRVGTLTVVAYAELTFIVYKIMKCIKLSLFTSSVLVQFAKNLSCMHLCLLYWSISDSERNKDETWYSIFPGENEELLYERWEDHIIWDTRVS